MKACFCLSLHPFAPRGCLECLHLSCSRCCTRSLHPENVDRLCIMSDRYGNNIQDRIEPESSSPPKKPSPTQSSSSRVPPSHGSQAAANRRERGNEIPQLTRSGPACTVTPATVTPATGTNPPCQPVGEFQRLLPPPLPLVPNLQDLDRGRWPCRYSRVSPAFDLTSLFWFELILPPLFYLFYQTHARERTKKLEKDAPSQRRPCPPRRESCQGRVRLVIGRGRHAPRAGGAAREARVGGVHRLCVSGERVGDCVWFDVSCCSSSFVSTSVGLFGVDVMSGPSRLCTAREKTG